jgi:1-deoxy-D-xylulose-5-phosphate reductoisomerase
MKRVAILGSTGSIGKNALEVLSHLSWPVVALAAGGSNLDLLEEQVKKFHPEVVAVYDKGKALELSKRLPGVRVVGGAEGLSEVATCGSADFVISAIVGTAGLVPTVAAIKAGKNIGLANKEVLVSGGEVVMAEVKKKGVELLPIDSEHSAIFQCLQGEDQHNVRRIILTSSGGPFRGYGKDQLENVTLKDALAHPTWSMGAKITVDSSTLMNKGLEVIEASWLFGMKNIDVIVHPQSIIHSMVEFIDGAIIAQLHEPTMQVPIQYALTYPERKTGTLPKFDFVKNSTLDFFEPDCVNFRCLSLAYECLKAGGSMSCYLNAANEILVERFLNREIGWKDITIKLEALLNKHDMIKEVTLENILLVDEAARKEAKTE